jgi:hypothetical protein
MKDWTTQLFRYCERALDPSFWAEPLNALTNIAFLLAALAGALSWLRQPPEGRRIFEAALIFIVAVIGTGSFLFHTYATRWAVLADVIPITIFMLAYLVYACRKFLSWGWLATAVSLGIFIVALTRFEYSIRCDGGPCLNGSLGYVPALVVLLLFGAMLQAGTHPAGKHIIWAGLIFAVSLLFRTVDREICELTDLFGTGPVGTHFIWHTLNAVLLYLLLRAAIHHGDFSDRVRRGVVAAGPPRARGVL